MLTPPLPTENPAGVGVAAFRRIQAGTVARNAAGNTRTGVLPDSLDPIVTGTPDTAMTYRIGQHVAVLSRSNPGAEIIANDAAEFVTTTTAPSANSRIDVIWERAQFPLFGDSASVAVFGVTQGVPNANPQKPSIPAGALELATAVVTSSDLATETCVITQTHRYTAMAGGRVLLRSEAEMNAWTPHDGAYAYRLDGKFDVTRSAGQWVRTLSRGRFAGSTNANGRVLITHNLGVIPSIVVPVVRDAGPVPLELSMIFIRGTATETAAQFFVSRLGQPFVSNPVEFDWIAFP